MEKTTRKSIIIDGFKISVPNKIIIDTEEYYISYNNRDSDVYGCSTTALVVGKALRFLILNGNHSKQYKKYKMKAEG